MKITTKINTFLRHLTNKTHDIFSLFEEFSLTVVKKSRPDFPHSRAFLGSTYVNAVHRGLYEREKVTQRLVVGAAEHKVGLEELVEGRGGGVPLARDGFLFHNDKVLLDATLPLPNAEEEGCGRLRLLEEALQAPPCLKKREGETDSQL